MAKEHYFEEQGEEDEIEEARTKTLRNKVPVPTKDAIIRFYEK